MNLVCEHITKSEIIDEMMQMFSINWERLYYSGERVVLWINDVLYSILHYKNEYLFFKTIRMGNNNTRRADLDEHETRQDGLKRITKEAYQDEYGNVKYRTYVYGADLEASDFMKLTNITEDGE